MGLGNDLVPSPGLALDLSGLYFVLGFGLRFSVGSYLARVLLFCLSSNSDCLFNFPEVSYSTSLHMQIGAQSKLDLLKVLSELIKTLCLKS